MFTVSFYYSQCHAQEKRTTLENSEQKLQTLYTGNTGIWLARVELTHLVLLFLGSCSHGFPHGGRGTAPAVEDPGGGGLGGRGGKGSWEGKERWYKIP